MSTQAPTSSSRTTPPSTASGGTLTFGSGSDSTLASISPSAPRTPTHKLSIWGAGTNGFFGVSSSTSGDIFQISTNGNADSGPPPHTAPGSLGAERRLDQRLRRRQQRLDDRVHRLRHRQRDARRQPGPELRRTPEDQHPDLDASSSLAEINALNPVTFNWIDPAKSSVPQFGFIAQQVRAGLSQSCVDDLADRAHARWDIEPQLHRPHLADRRGDPRARPGNHLARLDCRRIRGVYHVEPSATSVRSIRSDFASGPA